MSDSASLESDPLLPSEQQQIEMAINRDVRLKHGLVYGLLTGPAVWLAQVRAHTLRPPFVRSQSGAADWSPLSPPHRG